MKVKFTMDIFTDDHAEAVAITLDKMPKLEGHKVQSVTTEIVPSNISSSSNTSTRVTVISKPAVAEAPRWNIGYRISPRDEWKMWWHSGSTGHRTEEQAREEFYGLLLDPYWLAARDLRLIDAEGNIVDEHVRGARTDKRNP